MIVRRAPRRRSRRDRPAGAGLSERGEAWVERACAALAVVAAAFAVAGALLLVSGPDLVDEPAPSPPERGREPVADRAGPGLRDASSERPPPGAAARDGAP